MSTKRQQRRVARALVPLLAAAVAFRSSEAAYQDGDPACPCLTFETLPPLDPRDVANESVANLFVDNDNAGDVVATYGIGCAAHDAATEECSSPDHECSAESLISPIPVYCDRSWCARRWCYVDPANCTLQHRPSPHFTYSNNRYYSYGTCWDMDSFTANKRLGSLSDKMLRVGFNSNSGGWTGAYNKNDAGQHFTGPSSKWTGPAVSFVRQAAKEGGFRMNLTQPPDFLRNRSAAFFDSSSLFDYCVYSTALGYLDLCVAQYTVTDERAASANWILLGNQALYLVVMVDDGRGGWDDFVNSLLTIFLPFTLGTWLFVIFFVIPVMGILMIVHEYGKEGSAYPAVEEVAVTEDDGSTQEVTEHHVVPPRHHIARAVYVTILSVMQQAYSQSVVTIGAMLNLLGVSFFILAIVAVYTANLAAILTQEALQSTVDSLEEAIRANYVFCGERKNVEPLMELYGIQDRFVADPVDLGGDGKPGFNCPNCKSRTRVFDFLDPSQASDAAGVYCHAAIAPVEDLEVLKHSGEHCKKLVVGQPLRYVQTGLPVFDGVSTELISLFLKLKNDGLWSKELLAYEPKSICPVNEGGEGSALSIKQLTGIWIVAFGFAAAGLLYTFLQPIIKKRQDRNKKRTVKKLSQIDQWGACKSRFGDMESFSTYGPSRDIRYAREASRHLNVEERSLPPTLDEQGYPPRRLCSLEIPTGATHHQRVISEDAQLSSTADSEEARDPIFGTEVGGGGDPPATTTDGRKVTHHQRVISEDAQLSSTADSEEARDSIFGTEVGGGGDPPATTTDGRKVTRKAHRRLSL